MTKPGPVSGGENAFDAAAEAAILRAQTRARRRPRYRRSRLDRYKGELRDLTPETAVEYLRSRSADLGQKALDMHRQALQAMLVHVSRRLPEGERLTVVPSAKPRRTGGRAYRPEQIRMVAAAQNARNGLLFPTLTG